MRPRSMQMAATTSDRIYASHAVQLIGYMLKQLLVVAEQRRRSPITHCVWRLLSVCASAGLCHSYRSAPHRICTLQTVQIHGCATSRSHEYHIER